MWMYVGEASETIVFYREMGCGEFEYVKKLNLGQVNNFLVNLDQYGVPLQKVNGPMDGTEAVLEIIQRRMYQQEDSCPIEFNELLIRANAALNFSRSLESLLVWPGHGDLLNL